LDTVLLKVASRCNLDCSYCYVYNQGDDGWRSQPKRMTRRTIDAIIQNVSTLYDEQRVPFAVVLHGGEPLLLGSEILSVLLRGLAAALPSSCTRAIQTNGVLIDGELLDLCAETGTTLSISLDGPAFVHDRRRVDRAGRGSHADVLRGLSMLRAHPAYERLFTGTLTVIQPDVPAEVVYRYLRELKVPSMEFLLPDGNHDRPPDGLVPGARGIHGRWLSQLLACYAADPNPVPISILDNFARALVGGASTKEGTGAENFAVVVIETDGAVAMNDTLKSTLAGADRFRSRWNVASQALSQIAQEPEFLEYLALQRPSSSTCRACPYLAVCGGGMPLTRWSTAARFDNPSVYCADYKLIIDDLRARMLGAP
jgi:uncharacterized protein